LRSRGWNETFGWKNRTLAKSHARVYEKMARKLATLFGDDDVVDLGAGIGQYKDYFESIGRKGNYQAFDGAANVEDFTNDFVTYGDLTRPLIYTADWVLSLEVGEHIPAKFERVYVGNVVKNARKGLVVSWARPGQQGYSHVNLKSNADVIEILNGLGFKQDEALSADLRSDTGHNRWFKNTIFVFRRETWTKDNMW
jgi:hypothetical protein